MWWWLNQGSASSMYGYITFLFLANVIKSGAELYCRILGFTGHPEAYIQLLNSWWWSARLYLLLIILVAITGHLTLRLWKQRGGKYV